MENFPDEGEEVRSFFKRAGFKAQSFSLKILALAVYHLKRLIARPTSAHAFCKTTEVDGDLFSDISGPILSLSCHTLVHAKLTTTPIILSSTKILNMTNTINTLAFSSKHHRAASNLYRVI